MNVVFEGVNGSGKTTLISNLKRVFDENKISYEYVADLETETPLKPVLEKMFSESVFLELGNQFKTSLFESLVLAAEHHFIQEKFRAKDGIIIYDRDFLSILAYQKDIIKKDYPEDWEEFYNAFRTILLYRLKDIDLICYVSIPTEDNIKRTEQRDKRKFSEKEKQLIVNLKNNMEDEIEYFCEKTKTKLLILDGRENPETNSKEIINLLQNLEKNKNKTKYYTFEKDGE